MVKSLFFVVLGLLLCSCSKASLLRLAPPGILKYEEIASKKPPNPAIVEELAQRKENQAAVFPKLSTMPGANDRPNRRATSAIETEIAELANARDSVLAAVAEDQAAVAEELASDEELTAQRDALSELVGVDEADVKKERSGFQDIP